MARAPRFPAGSRLTRRKLNQLSAATPAELVNGAGVRIDRSAGQAQIVVPGDLRRDHPAHVRRFKVVSVQSDYLTCYAIDIDNSGTPTVGTDAVYVAKPYGDRGGGGSWAANDIFLAVRNIKGSSGVSAAGALIEYEALPPGGGSSGSNVYAVDYCILDSDWTMSGTGYPELIPFDNVMATTLGILDTGTGTATVATAGMYRVSLQVEHNGNVQGIEIEVNQGQVKYASSNLATCEWIGHCDADDEIEGYAISAYAAVVSSGSAATVMTIELMKAD